MLTDNINLNNVDSFVLKQFDKKSNEKMELMVDRFESISKDLIFWHSIDKDIFKYEFLAIEKFMSKGKFDNNQFNRIISILIVIFPLIYDKSLKHKMFNSVYQHDNRYIYNLLLSAKKMNSLIHIQDCLSVLSQETGVYFSSSDPSCASISVPFKNIESQKILDQIFTIATIFNNKISIKGDEKIIPSFDQILKNSGINLPLTIMNSNAELGYMTETLNNIGNLLNYYPGICIGELHIHQAARNFLIDNMNYFRSKGVTTIFMENFLEEVQEDLDVYFFNGIFSEQLYKFISDIDSSHSKGLLDIIIEARKCGIRIISIDRKEFLVNLNGPNRSDQLRYRLKNMNSFAAKKISNYMSIDRGKFLAIMGGGHLVERYSGIPGISDLIQCPPLYFFDLDKESQDKKGFIEQQKNTPSVIPIVYSSASKIFV